MHILVPDGDLSPIVDEVIGAIEGLHDAGEIPQFSIVYTDYRAPFARYNPNSGAPFIELSRRGPHPRLSLAHEIGHLLDHALGNFEIYSSEQQYSILWHVIETSRRSAAVMQCEGTVLRWKLTSGWRGNWKTTIYTGMCNGIGTTSMWLPGR